MTRTDTTKREVIEGTMEMKAPGVREYKTRKMRKKGFR
jgi:hypothetical protein